MNTPITFRQAEAADAARIWQIILQAKEQMRLRNSRQWQDGYPAMLNITADIERGDGYVLCQNGNVIAYGAVLFTGEPTYETIQGQWLSNLPYVVMHRLAVADEVKNRGIATLFMRKVEELSLQRGIRSFRVDTNFDNLYMLKMLVALDFTYCGEVLYDNNPRRAYEKLTAK
ncbi:GNAT family N-acetyltransferase [Candidatus Symbiothrix dinenymphae]|uniref:GNAT family N-acetyltransferase n=1 Tax=Candidatus Symbiothrix dinenymphae TaxID=467085 RepID=UPI0006BF16D9|nr:GNAT family N-acetyltransferase [Candidatus Symbiothrix dinenymphae]GAP72468.1 acetyltransferase [Candidatus Symbiothrix dinenymphae]